MRIGLIMVRHPPSRTSPIVPEMTRLLRERGATVDVILPDQGVADLATVRVEHDLYVLKSGTETALSVAGALDALGATIVNPYPVTALCRDKVMATRVLQAAGVPVPATYVTAEVRALAPLLQRGPLVVKPHRGSQGRGVHVVRSAGDLERIAGEVGRPVFAQAYHQPDGLDRKLYAIAGEVFGVQRVWPARSYDDKLGRPFDVDAELRDIVRRCGAQIGVDLFGLDVVYSDGRPYVVDFSSFPGFKGVPGAAALLADYVWAAGRASVRVEPVA
ncbi:MAG: hypothetical protein H0V19_00775 [Euzebyales bacterium]|nr:hypothetical protein [Euzebyales bacterium]